MAMTKKARRRRPIARALVALAIAVPLTVGVLFYGVNHVPWLGPLLANGLRAVLGDGAVSHLEDVAYRVEDRWNQLTRAGEKPRAHWETPKSAPSAPSHATEPAPRLLFRPRDVGPLYPNAAAPGDGVWVPVDVPEHEENPPLFYKTLVHPDPRRPWSELFIVAMDLRRVQLFAAAGTLEPKTTLAEAHSVARTGLIPEEQRDALVAAFNGGFKAEHGHYGMSVGGVTLLAARGDSCTIAAYHDGALRIGTWRRLAGGVNDMTFWRQTPQCLVEGGRLHPGLADEANISWGAALSGDTVVRRSALGLSADGSVLYMGVSNATTARVIALGMQHAGAADVAQLDINWSYPRFVLFEQTARGTKEGFGLFEGFMFDKSEYLTRPSTRDFFYVLRKD
jgi:hypothetical protein